MADENDSIIQDDREYTDEEMHALIDGTITDFDDGDLVTGVVVQVERDEVLLDIGYKSEGVIPARELSIRKDVDPGEVVKIGDEIEALVLQKEDKDGRLILSKKRAAYERAWSDIEGKFEAGQDVEGEVIEVVKGGLILDIGLRGFLPASLVDLRRVKDLHMFLGERLECRVIEMDRNRNNVVLSRRVVLEEDRKQERQEILGKLVKGMILPGTVSSIVDFGAFVDLGGIDGLVHISELSWSHVNHPSEVVAVGDKVEVQVLDVDLDRERISLGLKQTQDDPWKQLVREFQIGTIADGTVTKIVPFGAFVQIGENVEGLVHISEMARGHVEKPEDVVAVGDAIKVKIMDVDLERRRISLSIRAANEELGIPDAIPAEEEEAGEAEELAEEAEELAEEAEELAEEAEELAEEAEELAEEAEEPAEEVEEPEAAEVPDEGAEAAEETADILAETEAEAAATEEAVAEADEAAGEVELTADGAEEATEELAEETEERAADAEEAAGEAEVPAVEIEEAAADVAPEAEEAAESAEEAEEPTEDADGEDDDADEQESGD